jgi:hypothetical protein
MATTTVKLRKAKREGVLRLEGCPVSVAEQVLALVNLAGVKNPYLDPSQVITFNRGYFGWRARVALNRVMGKRYQKNGVFDDRGQAAPEVI